MSAKVTGKYVFVDPSNADSYAKRLGDTCPGLVYAEKLKTDSHDAELYAEHIIAYWALNKEIDAKIFGPGYDDDGNKIKTGFDHLIYLIKDFELHPYVGMSCDFDDEVFELLKKMLDVEDDIEKLTSIMDEVRDFIFAAECRVDDW
jgi:hypothetical protein